MTEWLSVTVVQMLGWSILVALMAAILFYLSRDQPFPEVSRRSGFVLLGIALILVITDSSPRDFDRERVAATLVTVSAGVMMVVGAWHLAVSHRDVVVAPMAGILLCLGAMSLFSDDWNDSSGGERMVAFITLTILLSLEMYLFFRGMIIGTSARVWSAAGLRQMQRGLLGGERGAIGCFERAWDMEKEYINAMSHFALLRINSHLGENEKAEKHRLELDRLGGIGSIDESWVEAIEGHLGENGSTEGNGGDEGEE